MGLYPPELIDLGDVVLRRPELADADELAVTVGANLDHLSPFMPWANQESATPAFQRERLPKVLKNWDRRVGFEYRVVRQDGKYLGHFALERRIGPDAIEIGYWLAREVTGQGYATRAAQALTEAGLALDDVRRVEIHCDEANIASSRVPQRLGYRLERVIDAPKLAPANSGRQMIWVYPAI